ncbi:MAG TPA: sulfotransferase [Bacteroidia bacterium]|nr:sulfotransferase [Bacteroidia bacterium]
MAKENIDRINNIPLNFVIGKERSGTTLLQVMLNAHSDIVAPPESRFIMLLYRKYGSKKNWNEKDVRAFCNDLYTESLFKNYWNIDKEKLYSSLVEIKENLTYPLLCKVVFYHFAPPAKDIKMIIDKNPVYYYFIPDIGKVFPTAKYIHIVRDYRANIVSHKRISDIYLSIADMAYRWLKVQEMIEDAKNKTPQQWITLKYESLVVDPDKAMKEVCSFLNISFEESMVVNHNTKLFEGFYQNQEKTTFQKFHNNMFRPINPSLADEWKEKMPAEDLAVAESIAGQFAEKTYGYKTYSEKSDFHISPAKLFIVKCKFVLIMKYVRLLRYRSIFFTHKYIVPPLVKLFNS